MPVGFAGIGQTKDHPTSLIDIAPAVSEVKTTGINIIFKELIKISPANLNNPSNSSLSFRNSGGRIYRTIPNTIPKWVLEKSWT